MIDGAEIDSSLFKMVKGTLEKTNGHIDHGMSSLVAHIVSVPCTGGNSVIAFADNSSSMKGFPVSVRSAHSLHRSE